MTRLWPQGVFVTVFTTQTGMPQVFVWGEITHQIAEISRQWVANWYEEGECVRRVYVGGYLSGCADGAVVLATVV